MCYGRLTYLAGLRKIAIIGVLVTGIALPAAAQVFEVIGLSPDRRPVPLTTMARIIVIAWAPPNCIAEAPPAVVTGRTIDFKFVVGGICGTPLGVQTSIDLGYLPAGTYTARRTVVWADGTVAETDTFVFEIVEAGTPLQIPALRAGSLALLAVLLLVAGVLAIR